MWKGYQPRDSTGDRPFLRGPPFSCMWDSGCDLGENLLGRHNAVKSSHSMWGVLLHNGLQETHRCWIPWVHTQVWFLLYGAHSIDSDLWEFRQVISYVSVKVRTCYHVVSPFMLSFKVRDNMSYGTGSGSRGVSCTGFLGLGYACLFGCCMPLVSASWNLYDLVRKALKTFLSCCGLNGIMFASHVSIGMCKFRTARWTPQPAPPSLHSVLDGWAPTGQVLVSLLWVFRAVFCFRALGHSTNPGFFSSSCGKSATAHISNICVLHALLRVLRRMASSSESPMAVNQTLLGYCLCKMVTLVIRVVSWVFLLSLLNSWCLLLSTI